MDSPYIEEMHTAEEEGCIGCAFYYWKIDGGQCRRLAPQTWLFADDDSIDVRYGVWPTVGEIDWCGEWRPMSHQQRREREELEAYAKQWRDEQRREQSQ